MSGNRNTIIAFNYFGGKFTWLESLYKCFPDDFIHLVDVFGGSFAVSLNYKGKVIRTANEINSEITNFFMVLRDHKEELINKLNFTPISKAEFNRCWDLSGEPVEDARRFYVRVRQSFFGLGAQGRNKGWHMTKGHLNCNGGETVSKFINGVEKLDDVAIAIRNNFQITNYDFEECINRLDFVGALFYLDPPYSKRSRASFNDYKFEFSDDDHRRLSARVHNIKGRCCISGYDCTLMNELYHDFYKTIFPSKKNNIRSGNVQEVVWTNYDPKIKKNTLTLL